MIKIGDAINLLNKLELKLKLNSKKLPLIILVSLIAIYIDYASLMKLQLQGIRTLTPKIVKLKEDINSLAKDLSRVQDLKKKIDTKEETQIPKLKKIISEGEAPLLLQAISDMANQNKVRIMQINTLRDTKVKEEIIAAESLLPITVTLDLSCTYHSLGSFINSLENARQFMQLQDMKIIRNSRDYLLESVSLTLKTYVKR